MIAENVNSDRYQWTKGDLLIDKPLLKGLVSKTSVQYTDNAADSNEQCRFCKFFNVQGYTCQKVAGSISPEGWCELYDEYTSQAYTSSNNGPLEKHCGVCEEDDAYAGAPIAREITIIFPKTNHANGVEIIAMCPPGREPKPALWKPEGGEDEGLIDWIGGPQYPREEAAYRLDRALGFFLVPVAYVGEANDEKGAAVYYTENALPPRAPTDYSLEWIEKAGILDYLICQKDRGYKHNYLTHPDDPQRMVLFDNGLSFPADGNDHYNSPFANAVKGQPISSEIMTSLSLCLGDVICWARIIGLVGPVAADAVRDRIQELLTNGWPLYKFNEEDRERDSHGRWAAGGGKAKSNMQEPTAKNVLGAPQSVQHINEVENKIRGNWKESSATYNRAGNLVQSKTGERDRVEFSQGEINSMMGGTVTHNHPPGGAGFSDSDLHVVAYARTSEFRAVGLERGIPVTYSMKSGPQTNSILNNNPDSISGMPHPVKHEAEFRSWWRLQYTSAISSVRKQATEDFQKMPRASRGQLTHLFHERAVDSVSKLYASKIGATYARSEGK